MLKAENDRINGILKSRLAEIEEWRSKYTRLEGNLNNLAAVEKDKQNMESKYNEQIRNN